MSCAWTCSSDTHVNGFPTVPIYYLAKPQPREQAWQNQQGKKTSRASPQCMQFQWIKSGTSERSPFWAALKLTNFREPFVCNHSRFQPDNKYSALWWTSLSFTISPVNIRRFSGNHHDFSGYNIGVHQAKIHWWKLLKWKDRDASVEALKLYDMKLLHGAKGVYKKRGHATGLSSNVAIKIQDRICYQLCA